MPGTTVAGVSDMYVTVPVGLADQPDFHNAVAALDVPAGPPGGSGAIALLLALKSIERAFGRVERVNSGRANWTWICSSSATNNSAWNGPRTGAR